MASMCLLENPEGGEDVCERKGRVIEASEHGPEIRLCVKL